MVTSSWKEGRLIREYSMMHVPRVNVSTDLCTDIYVMDIRTFPKYSFHRNPNIIQGNRISQFPWLVRLSFCDKFLCIQPGLRPQFVGKNKNRTEGDDQIKEYPM